MKAITVHDAKMPLVEYQGQRVVTFAMIDEAHQRPKETARKAFNRNRRHFIEGKDYFVVNATDVDWLEGGIKRPGKKITNHIHGKVTVFTEFGYLLLTKPFTDDLAWQVQRELVDGYFRHTPHFSDIRPVLIPSLDELESMPLQQAQDILTAADHRSHWRHGKHGSAEMSQRKRELKAIRPAIARITALVQLTIPGLEKAK
ncbi:ORF6N domain-containing protein [Serratia sp. M24T3]|uniref:ORF6N domain-containing protein n=1 Tax=Serratia sp. M24T3 TaxID=932213 RepID=UPI00025BAE85|nr:ORF6N domain-containing protein [Serratia sp. M24T3]EIC82979.1 bacteriophage protein [Serratia sp. M24T3]